MIKKIVEADNEAQAMEKAIVREKENLSKDIEAESQKIYDKYMKEAEATVKRNSEIEKKKAIQQWSEIQKKQNSVHIKLQSDYEQNCGKWVNEIVRRTIAK